MVPNIPHNGEKWGILTFYVPIPHFEAIPWGMGNIPHGEIGLPMGKIGEFSSNIWKLSQKWVFDTEKLVYRD